MGQYHVVTNLDKREFLNPHKLGDGLKLMEQALSGMGGTGSALIILLAASNGEYDEQYGNGRSGGDYRAKDPDNIIGRWAGDRIALVGDYAEPEDLPAEDSADLIYDLCGATKKDLPGIAENYIAAAERAEDMAENYPQNREPWLAHAERQRELARVIPTIKPYKDITAKVAKALERDGYIKYSKTEWGGTTRESKF